MRMTQGSPEMTAAILSFQKEFTEMKLTDVMKQISLAEELTPPYRQFSALLFNFLRLSIFSSEPFRKAHKLRKDWIEDDKIKTYSFDVDSPEWHIWSNRVFITDAMFLGLDELLDTLRSVKEEDYFANIGSGTRTTRERRPFNPENTKRLDWPSSSHTESHSRRRRRRTKRRSSNSGYSASRSSSALKKSRRRKTKRRSSSSG